MTSHKEARRKYHQGHPTLKETAEALAERKKMLSMTPDQQADYTVRQIQGIQDAFEGLIKKEKVTSK
jgi:hypothetical protein